MSVRALTIDVRSRRFERRLGVLAFVGVVIAVALLPLSPVLAILLLMMISAAVLFGFWSQGWLGGPERLTSVSWLSDGNWVLTSAAGKNIPATLSEDSRVGGRWVWLRWHTGAGRRSMLLLTGDVLPVDLRRLSMRLRLESGFRQQTQSRFVGA